MAVEEARLEDAGSGLTPSGPGWFVVNVGEAAWVRSDAFGGRCVFESSPRVLAERPDLEPQRFAQTGFTLAVLEPGKPTGMYHAESEQEDFLVLAGTCLLLIEEEERSLRAWDFVHCPPGTRHVFVGTGDGPCAIFMIGARRDGHSIVYPLSEAARARAAGVEAETNAPAEAYAPFAPWRIGRPDAWAGLPWAVSRAVDSDSATLISSPGDTASRTRSRSRSASAPLGHACAWARRRDFLPEPARAAFDPVFAVVLRRALARTPDS
jgi:uncharacterized cupin superfamily protein